MAPRIDDAAAGPSRPAIGRFSFNMLSQSVLLGVSFALLALIAASSVWLAQKSTADAGWVSHSLNVKNELSLLQWSIRRAESGERGYMLTADPAYLTVYQESADALLPRVETLRGLVADNPEQLARLATVAKLVETKHAELEQIKTLQESGKASDALALIRQPEGFALMRDFTARIAEMRAAESDLLEKRVRQTADTNRWLLATSVIGAFTIVVLAGISLWLIRRSTRRLRQAQAELANTNAHLEEKVEERTADLQEANAELQRFAYIVSHDLRSPLVNIMGFTGELDAIRKDWLELENTRRGGQPMDTRLEETFSDFDEALGFIKSSIAKMDRLIRSILDLSRAGRRDFKPEKLDLNVVLSAIRDAVAHQAQEADATIEVGALPTIESDRIAVDQIFSNLLDNAVKYLARDRKGEISVKAGERGNFVLIRVIDNGRGIDAADQDRVFDLFRRAGSQDRPGDGIGLAHVRALVRRLGGSIRLESEPDKGSTFTVILPKRWRQP